MTSPTTMVFVIDDDESVRKSLERMLDTDHYSVELFGCASEFLSRPAMINPFGHLLPEYFNGELEIDYQHNTVKFHPKALCEFPFSLPLTPLDVDVVRSLTQITRRLETHSQS